MGAVGLATGIAEVESEIAAEPVGIHLPRRGREPLREGSFAVAVVSALTVFAVGVAGYHPYAEDGGLYLAGVKRLLDPALYPHGTAFVVEPTRFSIFAPMLAGMVRMSHLGLPVVLLAVHVASIWVTLYAAWMLASGCFATRIERAGAVILLACWLTLPVAGTALLLMDPYATARSFSTPAMVLALVGAIDMTISAEVGSEVARRRRRGWLLCVTSLALATAIHPLMAAYALGATLILLCARSSKRGIRQWGTAVLAVGALGFAAFLQAGAQAESLEYIRVALTRTYWFVAEWQWYEWIGLVAPLAILAGAGWKTEYQSDSSESRSGADFISPVSCSRFAEVAARQALARMAVIVGGTACVIAILFARAGLATHFVARMQPLRAFQIVYLILILVLGAQLGERVLRRSAWRWAATMILLGGVMLGAERSTFSYSDHLELPGVSPRNPWVQAFLWIRDNTPKDALFALDADYINRPGEDAQCFRAIAERSALADYSKDGGEASIAPELTDEWVRDQRAQQGIGMSQGRSTGGFYEGTTDSRRVEALRSLGVTWVVLENSTETNLSCPYTNTRVKVCSLR